MALYIYKLSEKGVKTAAGFNHAGKKYTVDPNKRNEFRMETEEEHPAPDFMGLQLIEVRK
jgi:hypothetical protein